jgi:stage IV sporulation protein FB
MTRDDLIAGLKRDGANAAVGAVMRTDVPSVPRNTSFSEAFRMMQECRCPALAVIDETGRPLGLLTPENVGEMMMIHAALRPGETPAWRGSGIWRSPTPATSAS